MKKATIAAIAAAAVSTIGGVIIAKKRKQKNKNLNSSNQGTSSNNSHKHCTQCGKELNFLNRKYTCTRCGNIFCTDCIQKVTASEDVFDLLKCTESFVMPDDSIIKGHVLCPACAARFNNEVHRMNNAISSNKDVELVSINYQGHKKYSGSPIHINTPYYDDKRVDNLSKKDLIEDFIDQLTPEKDVNDDWHKFVKQQEKDQLDKIISEENLKPKETYEFVSQSFKNGEIEETGTAITRILPPIPLFSKNKENDRGKKKKSVISKLKAFFERFFDVSGGTFKAE